MKEMLLAALPWVLCGVAAAIICANLGERMRKTIKHRTSALPSVWLWRPCSPKRERRKMHNHENKAARSFASLTMADCITLLRIVGTAGLLFFLPLSPAFFLLYTFTGVTDVLDGWVARKTGTCSDAGARLDSIADLLFYGVTIVKLLPILYRILPEIFWLMMLAVAALRVASYAIAGMKFWANFP